MPAETLQRFRAEAMRTGGAARKRAGELLEAIRADAVAVIALASETSISIVPTKRKHLGELLEAIRSANEELRVATEADVAAVLNLADEAARVWEETWTAALQDSAMNRAKEAELLRWVLDETEQSLRVTLHRIQAQGYLFDRPLARVDELEARAAELRSGPASAWRAGTCSTVPRCPSTPSGSPGRRRPTCAASMRPWRTCCPVFGQAGPG